MTGSENGGESPSTGVKRALDTSVEEPASKNPRLEGHGHVSVKILVPSQAVGAIIGKGGEFMRALKSENHCVVHMSRSGDTYPGTSERVCLLKGRLENILVVINAINEKVMEKCETVAGDLFDFKDMSRGHELKIVMPNTSAGLVIGKMGANIKDIREGCDCQIQVHPKAGSAEAASSPERVVVLASEVSQKLMAAAQRVLERVAADPHHSSEIAKEERQTNYANVQATTYQNLGFAAKTPAQSSVAANYPMRSLQGTGLNFENQELLQFLSCLQHVLRESGFTENNVAEILGALQILAKYNIMAVGLGFGVQAMAQMRVNQQAQQQASSSQSAHPYAAANQGGYNAEFATSSSTSHLLSQVSEWLKLKSAK